MQLRFGFAGAVGLRVSSAGVLYISQWLAAMNAAPGDFSSYIAVVTIVGLLSLAVVRGTPVVIAREVAKQRDVSWILALVVKRIFVVSGAGLVLCLLFYFLFGRVNSYVVASGILFFIGIVVVEIIGAVLRGAGHFNRQLGNMLLGSLFVLVVMLLLDRDIKDYELVLVFGVGNIIAAALNIMCLRGVSVYLEPATTTDEGALFVTSLLTHIFYSIDKILAPILLPQGVAEIYAKVVVLAGRPIQIVSQTLEQYMLTRFSRERKLPFLVVMPKICIAVFFSSVLGVLGGVVVAVIGWGEMGMTLSIVMLVLSAYLLWPVYSMLGARIWSLGRSIYPRIYVRYFLPGAIAISGIGLVAVGYWKSVYIMAVMMVMLHALRAGLMFALNRRLDAIAK